MDYTDNSHATVEHRPWGHMATFARNQNCTVKIIEIAPNETLSLQTHEHRDELWIALDSNLWAEVDGDIFQLAEYDTIHIPAGSTHRASTPTGTRFLEVATGHYDDDDIQRLDDKYGRT